MLTTINCNHEIPTEDKTCDDFGCTDTFHPCQAEPEFIICGKSLTMNVYDEKYGADADGNRGVWMTCAEIYESNCECEHTDEEWRKLEAQAIDSAD